MLSRRSFTRAIAAGWLSGTAGLWSEAALAQRALVEGELPEDMVWLNANENPEGPPQVSLAAMQEVMPTAWRYHYQEFRDFYRRVAGSVGLSSSEVYVGQGSSEVLQVAVAAFGSASRPLITMEPTFELPMGVAGTFGIPVVRVPLTSGYYADVKKLAEEAGKAGGGLIYICNPNNPTAAVTPKTDIAWLVSNLPANTILLVDEAYIHFAETPEIESALRYVREGKDVIVARTFSKIYGMAGLRVGFGCARQELMSRMWPYRSGVISIVSARAVMAALNDAQAIEEGRRKRFAAVRNELCAWLRGKGLEYIEPHANFLMIDVGRDVREFSPQMARLGVAVGRPFPPLTNMLRVSIGAESDMARFRSAFERVYKG